MLCNSCCKRTKILTWENENLRCHNDHHMGEDKNKKIAAIVRAGQRLVADLGENSI